MSARKPELVAAEVIHDSWDYIAGRGGEKIRQLIFYSHLGRALPARVGQQVRQVQCPPAGQGYGRMNNQLLLNH